jgi:predicted Zn-dependent peptidase
MHAYLQTILNPENIYIVATGNIDHDKLTEQSRALENLSVRPHATVTPPEFSKIRYHANHDNEQTHLLWAMPAPPASADSHHHYELANHLLADGVSSYLYQRVREELGLVYSLHSRIDAYSDTGLWLLQTNTQPDQAEKCINAIQDAIEEWIDKGPAEQELNQSRAHIRSSLILEDDDLEASMDRIARESIYLGEVPDLETRLEKFDAITAKQLQDAVNTAWKNHSFISMGRK